jgi:hypothetical protein
MYLDSVFTEKYARFSYGSYYKDQLKKYIANKPNEIAYKKEIKKLKEKIDQNAQPKIHSFTLKKKNIK